VCLGCRETTLPLGVVIIRSVAQALGFSHALVGGSSFEPLAEKPLYHLNHDAIIMQ